MNRRYTIVIPVLNQRPYTQQCVESLRAQGVQDADILVIDNASTDDTPTWLGSQPSLRQVRNRSNLGCGGAWTQGALLALDSEWVVLLNNDVLAGPRAIEALLDGAERLGWQVVSPALLEGPNDYNFAHFAPSYLQRMSSATRPGWFHGVCFAVRRSVFETVGFPDTERQLGGHEDTEFLVRCLRAGIPVGTHGASVFHHFGSITQKAMKQASGAKHLGDRHLLYRKLGWSWLTRKRWKHAEQQRLAKWIHTEVDHHGHSLHMLRENERWKHV